MVYKTKVLIFLCIIFSILFAIKTENTPKQSSTSTIRQIQSIAEARDILNEANSNSLVIFDIGETLVTHKNNLLRIIRNHRIFDKNDINLIKQILSKFRKTDLNPRMTLLSNMLLNSPLYHVEPEMLGIIKNLQSRNVKVIAECTLQPNEFGAIKSVKNWRYSVLKDLEIDFSTSFQTLEIVLNNLHPNDGHYSIFYKGILFGSGNPKGIVLSKFIESIKWVPAEVIFFDDCEKVCFKRWKRANQVRY